MTETGLMEMCVDVSSDRMYLVGFDLGPIGGVTTARLRVATDESPTLDSVEVLRRSFTASADRAQGLTQWRPAASGPHRLLLTTEGDRGAHHPTMTTIDMGPVRLAAGWSSND